MFQKLEKLLENECLRAEDCRGCPAEAGCTCFNYKGPTFSERKAIFGIESTLEKGGCKKVARRMVLHAYLIRASLLHFYFIYEYYEVYSRYKPRPYSRGLRWCKHKCTSGPMYATSIFPLTSVTNFSSREIYRGRVSSICTLRESKSPEVSFFPLSLLADFLPDHRYPVCLIPYSLRSCPSEGIVRQTRCAFEFHGLETRMMTGLRPLGIPLSPASSVSESVSSLLTYRLPVPLLCYRIFICLSLLFSGMTAPTFFPLFTVLELRTPVSRLYYNLLY